MGYPYENRFRRHLLDMHISDSDPAYLSEFSPEIYAENLRIAKIQAPMIYLQAHTGCCYWPTASGHIHEALRSRPDTVRRLCDICHDYGMTVTGYYSLIYNTYEEDRHPEWRIRDKAGRSKRQLGGRYGLCCPNNPEYRNFVKTQIQEIGGYFILDGMFYDMLFWPDFCYCEHCRKRWKEETGINDMPEDEDWHSETWLLWVRKHEDWMGEFASWIRTVTETYMPGIVVEQNYASAVAGDWHMATSPAVNDACDFTGGDLYGDMYSHSFAAKYYHGISRKQPFEYMVCRCEERLSEHTVTKSEARLTAEAFFTCAHHGASLIIDAIDPVGTMDRRSFERIGRVFEKEIPYEPYLRGELTADVGIYYSVRGRYDRDGQGQNSETCAVGALRSLIAAHIPTDVISEGYPGDFSKFRFIAAPAIRGLTTEERKRLVRYVNNGGTLYFSGAAEETLLEELTGGVTEGMTVHDHTYLCPEENTGDLFPWFTAKYPMPFSYKLPKVKFRYEGENLATITLPYTVRSERRFAAIHSDPPGIETDYPALRISKYGKGTVIWCAAYPEADIRHDYSAFFAALVRRYICEKEQSFSSDAPQNVELIRFDHKGEILLSVISLNNGDEPFTVSPFRITVNSEKPVSAVRLVPGGELIPFEQEASLLSFMSKPLNTFAMYEIC